jgi:hypothetical protein
MQDLQPMQSVASYRIPTASGGSSLDIDADAVPAPDERSKLPPTTAVFKKSLLLRSMVTPP